MNGGHGIPRASRPFESPMTLAVRNSRVSVASNASLVSAATDVAEADPAQRIAADPSVIDAERHPLYGHGVDQKNWNGTPGRCAMYCADLSDYDWLSICDCFATDDLRKLEDARQGRLSRWQEQR